jgi:hypothetical protein
VFELGAYRAPLPASENGHIACSRSWSGDRGEVPLARVTRALIVDYGDRPSVLVIGYGRRRILIHVPRLASATLDDVLSAVTAALDEVGGHAAVAAVASSSERAARIQIIAAKVAGVAAAIGTLVAIVRALGLVIAE